MKKWLCALILFLSMTSVFADKIDKMIFFGDSLTDNGNLYNLLLHYIPKSPPYFKGRFSNGPTWAEDLGEYYANKKGFTYKIYARGGATSTYHPPSAEFITLTTLSTEIDSYMADELFKNKANTLYVIWIGGNDYLFNAKGNIEDETEIVIKKIIKGIKRINNLGGKHFLLLNLPDLSRTPHATDFLHYSQLHLYTLLHNDKLQAAVTLLKKTDSQLDISLINIYDIFQDVMQDPKKYNEKYHVNIVNTTNACWDGKMTKNILIRDRLAILKTAGKHFPRHMDEVVIDNLIEHSPLLRYTEEMGRALELNMGSICSNPDEYIFWDFIHPTAIVHNLLARMIIEKLDATV